MNQHPTRFARCAHPTVMADTVYAWPPGTEVTWHLESAPPTLTPAQALDAVARGIDFWSPACGVKVSNVDDPAQARLIIGFAPIDGAYRILGETQLPAEGRADVQHTMVLDSAENWTPDSLRLVVAHEFGHGIGLGHAPNGVRAIMDPFYDPDLTSLQPWDVSQAQLRYGAPATMPGTPTPATQPASPNVIELDFEAPAAGLYRIKVTLELSLVPQS